MPELVEILMVSSVSQSIMTDQPLGAASPFDYNVKSSSNNKIDMLTSVEVCDQHCV